MSDYKWFLKILTNNGAMCFPAFLKNALTFRAEWCIIARDIFFILKREVYFMRAVVAVIGKDTVGILAKVSNICAECNANVMDVTPVSYTHLDVYKRQDMCNTVAYCGGRSK